MAAILDPSGDTCATTVRTGPTVRKKAGPHPGPGLFVTSRRERRGVPVRAAPASCSRRSPAARCTACPGAGRSSGRTGPGAASPPRRRACRSSCRWRTGCGLLSAVWPVASSSVEVAASAGWPRRPQLASNWMPFISGLALKLSWSRCAMSPCGIIQAVLAGVHVDGHDAADRPLEDVGDAHAAGRPSGGGGTRGRPLRIGTQSASVLPVIWSLSHFAGRLQQRRRAAVERRR